MRRFLLFFVVFFSILANQANGQVLENYSSKVGITSSSGWLRQGQKAQVTLDVKSFPKSTMLISVPAGSTVFLDEFLWFYTDKDTLFSVPLPAFGEILKDAFRPQMDLTVVNKSLEAGDISIQKGFFDDQAPFVAPQTSQGLLNERRLDTAFKDFFFLALIIILFLFALFRIAFPILLGFITSPQIIFSAEDF